METTVENLSPTRVKITVEVPFDELRPDIDAAYRSVAKQVRIKGFRPGRVPPPVIDRQVGRDVVLQEAVDAALPRTYADAVRDAEVHPLSRPAVDITGFGDGQALVYTAELDVRPEFELPDVDSLAVTVDDADVDDAAVQEQVQGLREQTASLSDVDRPVGEGDFVVLDLLARVDGELVEGGEASGLSYRQGTQTMIPGLDEALLGLAAGQQATFSTQLAGGVMEGRDSQVTVTVQKVQEQVLPALDDELGRAGGFEDLAALRADVAQRLGRVKRLEQGVAARDRVLEAFVDSVDVPVPAEMLEAERTARETQLKRQVQSTGAPWEQWLEAEGKTEEDVAAEVAEAARRSVVAQLALDRLADREEIGVTQEELTEQVVRRAQSAGTDPQAYADRLVSEERIAELVVEVRRGKALAMLLESATVTDASGREVDLDRLSDDLEGVAAQRAGRPPVEVADDGTSEAVADEAAGDVPVADEAEVVADEAVADQAEPEVVPDDADEPATTPTA